MIKRELQTPLMQAMKGRSESVVRILLAHKADSNAADEEGKVSWSLVLLVLN